MYLGYIENFFNFASYIQKRITMIEIKDKKYFTKQEAADKLGITLHTLNYWLWSGKIKSFRVGVRAYISEDEMSSVIERNIERAAAIENKKKEGEK